MKLFVLWMFCLKAVIIPLNVLYERKTLEVVDRVHLWFFQQLVERYNTYLKDAEIFVAVEDIRSLTSYKNSINELELQQLANTDQIDERVNILSKINTSTILIAESPETFKDKKISKNGVCAMSYITSFASEDGKPGDTMTVFIRAYRKWLSAIFNFNVPDIFDLDGEGKMKDLVDNLKNSNIKSGIKSCIDFTFTGETQQHAKLEKIQKVLEDVMGILKTEVKKLKRVADKSEDTTVEPPNKKKKKNEESKDMKLLSKSFKELIKS